MNYDFDKVIDRHGTDCYKFDFAKVNEIYGKYFTQNCPARVCVEVSSLPKGALVEIDVIAMK